MMKKIKLKSLLDWLPKSSFKASEGLQQGKYPFFTSSQIQSKWISDAIYEDNCLIFGTGGNPSIHHFEGAFSTSTDCFVTKLKHTHSQTNIKFLYYFLKANKSILERGFRGAAIKHLSKSYLESVEVDIPNIEEQNRIVTILDKVEKLIEKRSINILKLDDMLLSHYNNLFGSKNPDFTNWKTVELQEYRSEKKGSMRTGPFGSSLTHDKFREEGEVAVLGIDNVVDNVFRWNKNRFISKEEYQKLKTFKVYSKDVLISIMGTVGRSAIVPEDIGLSINTKHLVAITLDEKKCNPYYLSYSIHSNPYIKQQISARSRGAVMDALNLSIIKQLKIKDVPIDLQNDFEHSYKKIQAIKSKLLDFTLLTDNLLKSLFNQYLSPRTSIDIESEFEAIINNINLLLPDVENNIDIIKNDLAFRQKLIDKLASQEFSNIEQYDNAKYIAFRLLKENSGKIIQEFDSNKKKIKLS